MDTHALVWVVRFPEKLGAKARRVIEDAKAGELGIPAAVVVEIGRLVHDDVIRLEGRRASEVFQEAFAYHTILPQSLDAAVAAPALLLPHGDPFDRLIVAAARELGVPLITKDANITDSQLVPVIW